MLQIFKSWRFVGFAFFATTAMLLSAAPLTASATGATATGGTLPAFPGAEGFGAKATGGRGGDVVIVTNLNDSGVGSLQWAVDQPGPRVVVFRVSGVITGDVHIGHGDLTLAGQTAPGAGITIAGHLYTTFGADYGNIIIRHLRVRPPNPDAQWPPAQHDAIQMSTVHTLILDHIDASHGADEIIDCWGGAYDITVQWSAITYPIYDTANGWTHNKGFLNHRSCIDGDGCGAGDPLGGRVSIHHNFFAHARNRTPAVSTGPAEVINNLTYNGREGFVHHNIAGGAGSSIAEVGEFNIMGNGYIEGPSVSLAPLWFDPENAQTPIPTSYFVFDNWVEDPGDFNGRVDNPYTTPGFSDAYTFACCGIEASQFDAVAPYDLSAPGHVAVTVDAGQTLEAPLLARVGAWPRDIVNRWAVEDVQTRGGAWGNRRPSDLLDGLTPGTPPPDGDNDGMADSWEEANGLDSSNPNDHSVIRPSGYTAIEEYINQLSDALVSSSIFADGFESGDTSAW